MKDLFSPANFGRNFGIAFQAADDLKDQDALVEEGVDLASLVKAYAQKAKDAIRKAVEKGSEIP